jgi:hypothetical protein
MTQEDKDLLFKELCCRLPYGVKVQCEDYLFTFDKNHMGIGMLYEDFNRNPLESPQIILSGCYYGEDIKLYLFPLSSMTSKQRAELSMLVANEYDMFKSFLIEIEFYHKHHFDYRGLIEKELALDATGLNIY